jgi:hypothetical protein
MKESDNGNKAYMATGKCGKMVGAIIDVPDLNKEVAKFAASFIKDGFSVNHVTDEDIHQAQFCKMHGKCKTCPELLDA